VNLSGLPWIDSLLNASMILAGMGPVDPLKTASAKLFATKVGQGLLTFELRALH
jgi:hypothetical protein